MKILVNADSVKNVKGENHMMHGHRGPARPILPPERKSERKARVDIEYDEQDWELMRDIYGDEDTAAAAAGIIWDAPPEIQILHIQFTYLIKLIKEVA